MAATNHIEHNERFDLAYRFVTETAENIFLTGKAGTGKTTFLKYLKENCLKNMLIAAPTGVAAINAGGVTLHSLCQIPFGPLVPDAANREAMLSKQHMSGRQRDLLRAAELMVIDEISMVRADVLDAIDSILKHVRRNYRQPFGGLQMLFIGDLHQLPPVVKDQEWHLLREHYPSPFFFDSIVLRDNLPMFMELTKIYRQKNESFTRLLNAVRLNQLDEDAFSTLNERFIPGFKPNGGEKFITLTSHNKQADLINAASLAELPTEPALFISEVEGEFPESMYPADAELKLKVGAQVMFIKNDPLGEKQYYNGKIGTIESFGEESICVRCGESQLINVPALTWENTRYQVGKEDGKLEQHIIGTFTQFPLRLAWAITIHKSQGLTFEKMMIDASQAFSTGQVYVALSRCTTLEGIVLLSKIPAHAIQANQHVENAHLRLEREGAPEDRFEIAKQKFTYGLLSDVFSFESVADIAANAGSLVNQYRPFLNADADSQAGMWKIDALQMKGIGSRFDRQLQQLIVSENPANAAVLQERISAAANHFQPQVLQFLTAVETQSLVTDSKEVADQINNVLFELAAALHEKLHLLSTLKTEFSIHQFYKSKSSIAPYRKKITTYAAHKTEEVPDGEHHELMIKLKKWRNAVCERTGLPVFKVASQNELRDICRILPRTAKALATVKGFGEIKVKNYSDDIIDMVMGYADKCDLASEEPKPKESKKHKKKSERTPTSEVSFGMFMEGLSLQAIAEKRNLTYATVLSHFHPYVSNNSISPAELFSPEKLAVLEKFCTEYGDLSYGELKMMLPENIIYAEVQLMKAAKQLSEP